MKSIFKYIIVGVILLLGAFLATLYVWFELQNLYGTDAVGVGTPTIETDSTSVTDVSDDPATTSVDTTEETTQENTNTLPINESQRKAAEAVGVDVDSIEITPAMLECAEGKLSAERIKEIVAGDSPGVLETLTLLPCLKAE
jgi:hypothetical protein